MTFCTRSNSVLSYPGALMIPHISSTTTRDRLPVAVSFSPPVSALSSKQDQGISRNRRSGDFRIGEVGFEADRVVISRGFVTKSVQAVEFEHRPGRFDAIRPSTNLGILEESWCNHMRSDTGLGIKSLPDWLSAAPIPQTPAISNRHDD